MKVLEIPVDDFGWFPECNQISLQRLIEQKNVKTVIELGTFIGKSAFWFAERVDKVYTIDNGETTRVWDEMPWFKSMNNSYHIFLSNLQQSPVKEKIEVIRMDTTLAAGCLDITGDLIYVDAGHTTERSMLDILAWSFHLNKGGVICGDDYNMASVKMSVDYCAHIMNKVISFQGQFWWLS